MNQPNEEYNPVEPNYYNYESTNNLEGNIDYYLRENEITHVNICAYVIDNKNKYPFLKYLLFKNFLNEVLEFPKIMIWNGFLDSPKIQAKSEKYVYDILALKDYAKYVETVEFKGFYVNNNNVYIFYNLTDCEMEINDIYRENRLWFGLITEIVNDQHICNFVIDPNVYSFFIENNDFCFLKNEKNENYILPFIGYSGKNDKLLHFTYIFGVTKKDKSAILGPYYYFSNYTNAIREGGWSPDGKPEYSHGCLLTESANGGNLANGGKYVKGGIVRFALFLDKIKFIQNAPYDKTDLSEIKKERLYDESLNINYERLTTRISDHDGMWSQIYDSVYLGTNVELDNGEKVQHAPIIVIRDYDQQVPLSYHYIDKQYLMDTFDKDGDYLIM